MKTIISPYSKFKKKRAYTSLRLADFIFEVGESPLLRKKSNTIPLKDFGNSKTQESFKYVKDCLIRYRKITGYGRGLTAVQVGIPLAFSAIYKAQTIQNINSYKDVNYDDILIIANPNVIKTSKKLLKYPEMCMSLSPVIVPTIRPSWLEFEYYDERGDKKIWDTKDDTPIGMMMNRVFMHELDHIKGTINIDIVKDPREVLLHANPNFYSSAKFEEV